MGGDDGVSPLINGFIQAYKERPNEFEPIFVGDENLIKKELPKEYLKFKIVHTPNFISMSDSATSALKQKDSSIYKAMELHKNKEAGAVISAGHSGATMSLATLKIGRIKGVKRPSLSSLFPTTKEGKITLVLDLGANVDSKSEFLYQSAFFGKEYMHNVLGISDAKVGLLSNGEEESKGNELTKETFSLLKEEDFFIGNVEGNDIYNGSVDVVVCDGFTGNLVLKASEGAATAIKQILKESIYKEGIFAKIGALLMKGALNRLKKKVDWAERGGAPLLGINGCVIISHGKSNAKAIKNAIFQAIDFANSDTNENIYKSLNKESSQ